LNPISPSNLDSHDGHGRGLAASDAAMPFELLEPVGADLRRAATASAILEALRTGSRILGPTTLRTIPMIAAVRSLASLPGGVDRPRPMRRQSSTSGTATSDQASADVDGSTDAHLGRRNRSRSRSIRPRRHHHAR